MIVRVWGTVNSTEIVFTPVPDRPGYWEGMAPRVPGLQEIEIWAENDKGARGHLQCSVQVFWHTHTAAKLVLLPYVAGLLLSKNVCLRPEKYNTRLNSSRKAAI